MLGGTTLWLTAPELAEITAEVDAVIRARVDRAAEDRPGPERRPVRLFLATSVGLYDPGTG